MQLIGRSQRRLGSGVAALLAAGAVVTTAEASTPPAKDTFNGRLTLGTGTLKGDAGRVTILLRVAQSPDAARPITVTFRSPSCARAAHCLRLVGALSGTISSRPGAIPDIGKRYDIVAAGRLAVVGPVTTTGQVVGVGFIRRGHESLSLRLRAAHGGVTIVATSPAVPGFSSP